MNHLVLDLCELQPSSLLVQMDHALLCLMQLPQLRVRTQINEAVCGLYTCTARGVITLSSGCSLKYA